MKTKIVFRLSLALVLVMLVLGSLARPATAQSPTKLKLGYSVWVGYGPLFIAREKGYFKDEGLDIELVKVEDPKDRFTALAGKQLDGVVTTLDTMSQYWNKDASFKAFLALDESSGGDGVVAAKADIKTVKDLKGKQVGVNVGSVSQFFLEYVLQQNGLTSADLTMVKMKQGDVPAALAASRVDAGVTWDPHLSKSVKAGGTLVISSKDTPGLIVDIMLLRDDVMKANPKAAQSLVNAWNKSIDYWKANTDEANGIMGGFYEKADDIKADLQGATLFDAKRNAEFFTGTDKGSATATLKFAIDFYTKAGIITTPVKAEDMLDSSLVAPKPKS